jgi:hypothetical protein
MSGEERPLPEPLVIGQPYLLSAFSPIAATFRFIERDLRGATLPLFGCAVVGSLETLSLLLGLARDWPVMLVLVAVWLPVSSYCSASMLAFALRVMRGQPYRPRDVWRYHPSTPHLALFKLLSYALFAGLAYAAGKLVERAASISPALPFLVLPLAMVLGLVLLLRLCLAPVVLVDRQVNALGAVRDSLLLTRGQTVALAIYGIVLTMIAGMSQAICGLAVLSTLATPGLVYLYQTLRGEPPG